VDSEFRLLGVLLSGGEKTIETLRYLAANEHARPKVACRELRMGRDRWYATNELLADLDLAYALRDVVRGRRQRYGVTERGKAVLRGLSAIEMLLADSPAGVAQRLKEGTMEHGSAEVGARLCALMERAALRTDWATLVQLQFRAGKMRRYGEAHLGSALEALLRGEAKASVLALEESARFLRTEKGGRSWRRMLLALVAAHLEAGEPLQAFRSVLEAQSAAVLAGDRACEAEARAARGMMMLTYGKWNDALHMVDRALGAARESRTSECLAAVSVDRSFVLMGHDPNRAAGDMQRALQVAEEGGIHLLVLRASGQLAACHAVRGDARAAAEQLELLERRRLRLDGALGRGSNEWRRFVETTHGPLTGRERRQRIIQLARVYRPAPIYAGDPSPSDSGAGVRASPDRSDGEGL